MACYLKRVTSEPPTGVALLCCREVDGPDCCWGVGVLSHITLTPSWNGHAARGADKAHLPLSC